MALGSTPDGTTPANGASSEPAASQDGRFIAFASTATNLGIVPGGFQQIYVRDTCTGVTTGCSPATRLVSSPDTTLAPTTPAKGLSEHPSVNGCDSAVTTTTTCVTGQFIAFASVASNLSGNVASGVENIFVRNTCEGITTACIPGTVLVSQAMGAPPAADGNSVAPAISGDGHTIAFISFADDLVAHDTNGLEDIFLAATSF